MLGKKFNDRGLCVDPLMLTEHGLILKTDGYVGTGFV